MVLLGLIQLTVRVIFEILSLIIQNFSFIFYASSFISA